MMSHVTEQLAAPTTAAVQIRLDPTGTTGTVAVNGADLSTHVKAVYVTAVGGQPAQVELVANTLGGLEFDGPGVVTVTRLVDKPWQAQAEEWLLSLHPQEIQGRVAEGSMGQPLGDAVIGVLVGMLRNA